MIIGGGGKRVLGIAAREADIVGVNGTLHAGVIGPEAIATMTREAVVDKVAIVADAARDAGRLDHIEMNVRTFFVSVTDDRDGQIAAMAGMIGVDEQMIRRVAVRADRVGRRRSSTTSSPDARNSGSAT